MHPTLGITSNIAAEPARPEPIIPLLPYQRADVESDARFRWNCWSRQSGKSFTKALRRLLRGLKRRRTQVLLSAGERQSRELMAKVRQHCEALKIATDYHDSGFFKDLSVKQLEIVLPGRVRIIGLPANPMTARGFTGDVLLDEFAMHAQDRDIWGAMLPTVLRGEGELDVASTPKGKGNVFYELGSNPRFERSVVTLPDAISQGLQVDEAEMREAMGDETLFRQEFLCEFLDETTAFLTYDRIASCCDPELVPCSTIEELASDERDLYAGIDIGRVRDLTIVWVLAREGDRLETAGLFELSNAPFREQFDLIADLLSLRQVRRCCIDAGGLGMQLAEQAVERFGEHRVEAVTFTAAIKSQLAGSLRIAVEAERIRIPNSDVIRNDWHSVQRKMTESGHIRLVAPRQAGSHADRFWAAALAVQAAEDRVGRAESMVIKPIHYSRTGIW